MALIKHRFQFGGTDCEKDDLANKIITGEKTATSSLYDYYLSGMNDMSRVGDFALVLDSTEKEICTVRIDRVEILEFKDITDKFAQEEGDGNLENWLRIHISYYSMQLAKINKELTSETKLVCEWFSVVK